MSEHHQVWLEDVALRLLCVLALDRFGDFLSDAVVAPVRETCAQCLCAVLKLMDQRGCKGTLAVLLELLTQKEWEARHGGFLGLKYLLAVREDMTSHLIQEAFHQIVIGLLVFIYFFQFYRIIRCANFSLTCIMFWIFNALILL